MTSSLMSDSQARVGLDSVQEAGLVVLGAEEADPVERRVVPLPLVGLHLETDKQIPDQLRPNQLAFLLVGAAARSDVEAPTWQLCVHIPKRSPLFTVRTLRYSLVLNASPARSRNTFSSLRAPDSAASTAIAVKKRLCMSTSGPSASGWKLL
ncbi:hypothetical protein EYF80_063729 [Liparis tanakae]|uniref:Uncharacterized protein n=1 Tax=Liparis tanakae TaxID=230148 RepID=A0A4Z2EC65_9TELE|nr:hypothetical protein EYF80_063729 [Liparis tanakae]